MEMKHEKLQDDGNDQGRQFGRLVSLQQIRRNEQDAANDDQMTQADQKSGTEQEVAEGIQGQVVPVVQEESDLIDKDQLHERKKKISIKLLLVNYITIDKVNKELKIPVPLAALTTSYLSKSSGS